MVTPQKVVAKYVKSDNYTTLRSIYQDKKYNDPDNDNTFDSYMTICIFTKYVRKTECL